MGRCPGTIRVLFAITLSITTVQSAGAAAPLTDAAANAKWNYAAASRTATFLGNDQPGEAVLELQKSAILGGSISIQSDATALRLASGTGPELAVAVTAKADGSTTELTLEGGDDPHITINSVLSPRLQGKWIQIVRNASGGLKISLEKATFASVQIDQGVPQETTDSTPVSAGPAPAKELLQDIPPERLVAAEKLFASSVAKRCSHCGGTGKITTQVQVGEHREGAFIVPDFRDQTSDCPVCDGKGTVRSSDEVLRRLAATFLKDLAHLDQSSPTAQDAISQSYEMITGSMIGDFKTWTMLNQNGRSVLSRPSPETGTPVIAQVEVLRCDDAQGGRKDYTVRLIGTDQQAHVMNPVSADRVESGFALMGGFVDNDLVDKQSLKKTPVISNGFLIAPPIQRTWYWWWDWRWNGPE